MKQNYKADVAEMMLKLHIKCYSSSSSREHCNSLMISDLWWVWWENQLWWNL